ncbi:MAG TPA: Mov34/MPN/PAD-1 family protein [Kofleriaceae bacterium]|nr:Mov34/MPN/PAD-1 family protein [Kofleriaceae bacterium]
MTPIAIPAELLEAIYAHAIAAFPDECCGYLIGRSPALVDGAVACRNAQADGEHPVAPARGADTGFVITGAELFRFARSFDGDHPARIVYHSHTNGRAYFSAVDRQVAAVPGWTAGPRGSVTRGGPAYPVQHVVIGVATGAASDAGSPAVTEVAQFAWSAADGDYVEVARWVPGGRA